MFNREEIRGQQGWIEFERMPSMLEQRLLVLDFRLVLESASPVNASSLHFWAFYNKALAMSVNWSG